MSRSVSTVGTVTLHRTRDLGRGERPPDGRVNDSQRGRGRVSPGSPSAEGRLGTHHVSSAPSRSVGWWIRGTRCPPQASSERALKALAVTSRPPARGQTQGQTVAPVCFALCLLTLLLRCLEEQDLFSRRILHGTRPAPESSVSPAGPAPAPPGDLPTLPARDPLGCLASPTGGAHPRPQGHLMESETRAGWASS